jgi:hypothetical protein
MFTITCTQFGSVLPVTRIAQSGKRAISAASRMTQALPAEMALPMAAPMRRGSAFSFVSNAAGAIG